MSEPGHTSEAEARSDCEWSSISAVVLNADGTVKADLGVVSFQHKKLTERVKWALWGKPAADARIRAHNQQRQEANP